MNYTIDIETALYDLLAADDYSASAHALPAELESDLPHVHVVRTGGYTADIVLDTHQVDFDVYADDAADAMTEAISLTGWVRALAGTDVDTPCYQAEVITLPYNNPDPRHPTIGRATFKAQILTRTKGGN